MTYKGSCYKIWRLGRKNLEIGISKSLEDAEKYCDYLVKKGLEKRDKLEISKVHFQ